MNIVSSKTSQFILDRFDNNAKETVVLVSDLGLK